jgi:hypothetical protein
MPDLAHCVRGRSPSASRELPGAEKLIAKASINIIKYFMAEW